jgi:hypothetical protein
LKNEKHSCWSYYIHLSRQADKHGEQNDENNINRNSEQSSNYVEHEGELGMSFGCFEFAGIVCVACFQREKQSYHAKYDTKKCRVYDGPNEIVLNSVIHFIRSRVFWFV